MAHGRWRTQKMPSGDSYAVALYIKNRELDAARVKYDMPPDFVYENQSPYVKMGKISSYNAKISQGGDADMFVSVCSSDNGGRISGRRAQLILVSTQRLKRIGMYLPIYWGAPSVQHLCHL